MTYRRSDDHLPLVDKGIRILNRAESRESFYSLDDGCSSLSASLKTGTLSIVVGAGMSKPCGIPDWPKLVENLLTAYLAENYAAPTADLLRYLGATPIIQIRILRRLYNLKVAFLTNLHRALYANLADPPITPALEKLARLIVDTHQRGHPLRLITYNFDDLLENAIRGAHPSIPIQPIFSEDQRESVDGIRVFHPHGYIPRENDCLETCAVIFGEDEFHALMSDNAHWANALQLNAFRDGPCLFVGTSLSDPNVRRLLDRCRQGASQVHWLARTPPHSITDPGLICHLLGEELASLGVRVLGLSNYDDLEILFERLNSPT